jgi:phage baseplate assembly protein V
MDHVRVGTIVSFDPNTYSCKVMLQPENVLSGWIPILSPWVGKEWGLFAPPGAGVAVAIIPREGELDAAMILPGFFNDEERPLSVEQGEFWLVHESGASFKLTNDGKLAVNDGNGASVTLNGDGTVSSTGTWNHTGDFNATGNVSDSVRSMAADRLTYNTHTHPVSGANTTAPTQ